MNVVYTDFLGSTNTINICLSLSTIYSFIPLSDCVGKDPSVLLCPETYATVKTALPAYGVYISQLIRYSRACGSYQDFLDRGLLLTSKLSPVLSSFMTYHRVCN
jgi:hypothetical protein